MSNIFESAMQGDVIRSPDKKYKHEIIQVISRSVQISYPYSDTSKRVSRIPWIWITKETLEKQEYTLLLDKEMNEKRKKKGGGIWLPDVRTVYSGDRKQAPLLGSGTLDSEFPLYNRPYFYLVVVKGKPETRQAFYFGRQIDNERILMGNCFESEKAVNDYLDGLKNWGGKICQE